MTPACLSAVGPVVAALTGTCATLAGVIAYLYLDNRRAWRALIDHQRRTILVLERLSKEDA